MIEFRVLGSVDLKGSEGETLRSVLAQPKRVALLAYLAVAKPNGFHRRDKLLGLFWPESDQEHGRGALRKALYRLRQSLGEEVIVSRGDEEVGLAERALRCDAVAFEQALEAREPEEALDLYRGSLLEGFYIAEAPEFERWLDGERERLCTRASEAAWTLVDQAEAAGNGVEVARWARKAVSFSPTDEVAFRRLLERLDRLGDRTGAIKEYEAFARRSQEEYDAEPSPETQALVTAIREREVAATGASAEGPVEAQAGVQRAPAPEAAPVTRPSEPQTEPRPVSLLRVFATYALISLAVLVAVHIFTLQLGLPDWFFPSAVVVLLACLPIIVATALVEGAVVTARRADAEAEAPLATARRRLTWRNAVAVTVIAFAILGLAVAGYTASRSLGIGPLATLIGRGVLDERDRIVLARFDNLTPDSTLGLVVTELLRTDLQQSPVVSVAERNFVAAVVKRIEKDPSQALDYETAREVAIREGLKAVVAGQVGSLGSGFVISTRLVVAETGEVVFAERETAKDGDGLIPASERLSRRLRERIGESLKSIRSTPRLWRMQTASLEALRLAREADEEIRRGRPSRSVELASRAIELDSLFMGAYMIRAMAGGNSGQGMADLKKAYALRDRGSLTSRYFIEALYHGAVTGDEVRQLEALKMCLEVNPWQEGAIQLLGIFYFNRRVYARAEDYFRRRLELNRYAGTSWHSLSETLAAQGKWEETEEALRRWQENMPEHPDIPEVRRHVAASRGDYRAAEAQTRALGEGHRGEVGWRARTSYWLAVLARLQGRLAEAERHLDDAIDARESQGRTDRAIFLSSVKGDMDRWFKGDTAAALRRMEAALDRWPLDSITFTDQVYEPYSWIVDFYAQAGRIDEAKAYLAQYEAQTEYKNNRGFRMWRHYFRGAIALAEDRPRDAIQEYRQADRLEGWCHVCAVPRLAFAYDQAGEPDSALAVYERYVTMPWPYRVYRADSWWLAFALERLGDLYEQRSDTAKAIYYYGKLVDLWKDADPELQPRVEAARRAIEALSPDT